MGPGTVSPSRGRRRESLLTGLSIAVTLGAAALLLAKELGALWGNLEAREGLAALERGAFLGSVGFLLYGNFVYQAARLGYLQRRRQHAPAPRAELERLFDAPTPTLTILVPSYREELRTVRQTLLSAALQDYPKRRVVLLIDDPPTPADAAAAGALTATRGIVEQIRELLAKPSARFASARDAFLQRAARGDLDVRAETELLAELHAEASGWFLAQASNQPIGDHTDRWFSEVVFETPARALLGEALELEAANELGPWLDAASLRGRYERIGGLFSVEITHFERKRYANLSHEPNKAMNLNAYIGLLGGRYREVAREGELHLEHAGPGEADLVIPDAEFLLTLDADSLLAFDYALRLVHVMRTPGNERIAVAQTPYSAVPGALGELERLAGATTDVKHIVHQGFTRHQATYWVGANALLRTAALRELRCVRRERGFEVTRFIQDRTVIEDTDSSVDLVSRGWQLFNYPERLAWSATPPDFGALLIQRRRWANGGLLVLPRLLRAFGRSRSRLRALGQLVMRCHYLTSPAGVSLGLLVLLLVPFESVPDTPWLVAASLPYFVLYGRDLAGTGYRFGDVVRVYGLNLLLLPVNLGGVLRSLQQAVTRRKTPFGRTPKVAHRTGAPPLYVLAEYGLLAALALVLRADVAAGRHLHALFVAVNGALLAYALLRLYGTRAGLEDLGAALPARVPKAVALAAEPHGTAETRW